MRLSALRRHDLGVRQSAIVKLDRRRLLHDVALCVAAAGARSSRFGRGRVEAQFWNESGFDIGVTRGFYTDAAAALCGLGANAAEGCAMWIHDPERRAHPALLVRSLLFITLLCIRSRCFLVLY